MKISLLLLVLIATIVAAETGKAPSTVTPARSNEVQSIEEAVSQAYLSNITRAAELSAKQLKLLERMKDLARDLREQSPKPTLTPSERDELNMLNAQLNYLKLSQYAEVLKRRRLREIGSLLAVEKVMDDTLSDLIATQQSSDPIAINEETRRRLNKELGPQGLGWGPALNGLAASQGVKDALTIPLSNLVERLKLSTEPGPNSDELDFLLADDLKNTKAYQIFRKRLEFEQSKGNSDATALLLYFDNERK